MAGLNFTNRPTPSLPPRGKTKLTFDEFGVAKTVDADGNETALGKTTSLDDIDDAGDLARQNAAAMTTARTVGAMGFTTGQGAGGATTQTTSKSTTVTLNAQNGELTTAASSLTTTTSFTFNNSALDAGDHLDVVHKSGGTVGGYLINAGVTGAGAATIYIRNTTGGALSEALVLKFKITKGGTT